jgi:hypothetical protein
MSAPPTNRQAPEDQAMTPAADTHSTPTLSASELDHLHSDDIHAARIVVGIMTAVFTAGLLLYAAICWIVM